MEPHDGAPQFPFSVEGDRACEYVRLVGLKHAHALHLSEDDCEDCALGFVVHLLNRLADTSQWLNACARHYALNYLRHSDSVRIHEVTLTEGVVQSARQFGNGAEPLKVICRSESLAELASALASLRPNDEEYLLRFYYAQEPASYISLRTGKRLHAVEQGIFRARRRLAVLLLPTGCTTGDFSED